MRTFKNRRSGFTLVELLMVCAIVSLLAALAIPRLGLAKSTAEDKVLINAVKSINGGIQRCAVAGITLTSITITGVIDELVLRQHLTAEAAAEYHFLNNRLTPERRMYVTGSGTRLECHSPDAAKHSESVLQ